MRRSFRTAAAAAAIICASQAFAADRVALVVGNAAYKSQHVLANPANDAADVGAMLRKLGFDVVEGVDVDANGLRGKVEEFSAKLEGSSLALFYYSGHGIQVDGRNYVVPVDAKLEKAEDVKFRTMEMDFILKIMERDQRVNIVILDACRDNPFAKSVSRGTRAAESAYDGALAQIKGVNESLIIYATDSGNVAQDGEGRNSPFTEALLRIAPTPGMEIVQVAREVKQAVTRATQSKQVPWLSLSLGPPVYLAGEAQAGIQLSSLRGGGEAPVAAETLTRLAVIPANPVARPPAPSPAPAPAPVMDAGEACDRAASDIDDPARSTAVPIVRAVRPERAIPACEKAVEANPGVLRFVNQLGRAYHEGKRYEEALRTYKQAADRGSPYAVAQVGYLYYRGWGGAPKDAAAARLWFEKAAALGVPGAMANLGYMHAHGISVPRNSQKALEWLEKGAALDHAGSLNNLADLYQTGTGVPKDLARAHELYERTAAMDDPNGMNALGFFAQQGLGQPQDFEAARHWYEKAAAYDSPDAMYNLGYLFQRGTGGVPVDYKIAREWFERASKINGDQAMVGLAYLHLNGQGVDRDMAKARDWLEKAAGYDNTFAMTSLARNIADGSFGPPDAKIARFWLERAAALDDETAREMLAAEGRTEAPGAACDRLASIEDDPLHAPGAKFSDSINTGKAIPACEQALKASPATLRYANQLGYAYVAAERYADAIKVYEPAAAKKSAFAAVWMGNLHDRGLGVPKNAKLAASWFEKAAKLGSVNAMYNLGQDYSAGDGVALDLAKARGWFEQAAKRGEPESMRRLGDMYFYGKGATEDDRLAREWYEKAAKLGNAQAKNQLGLIYFNGNGVESDARAARNWFGLAASDGNATGMRNLAELYIKGEGGAKELAKARGLLEQAAGLKDVKAAKLLAQGVQSGLFDKPDPEAARKWYGRAAELGDEDAKRWLAGAALGGSGGAPAGDDCDRLAGDPDDPLHSVAFPAAAKLDPAVAIPACEAAVAEAPDNLRFANQLARSYNTADRDEEALKTYQAAASRGSADGALWVGQFHAKGLGGLPASDDKAMEWFGKAADLGSTRGMVALGVKLFNRAVENVEPEKNAPAARLVLERAAALGQRDAMRVLSRIHENGIGVAADPKQAVAWLRKAAAFEDAAALNMLAVRAFSGDGIEKDPEVARKYLERSVAAGDIDGARNLAYVFLEGIGGPKDVARAKKLYESGVAKGDAKAMKDFAEALEAGKLGKPDKAGARKLYEQAAARDAAAPPGK